MHNVDIITRYNEREIRRMTMRALGQLQPDALRQIIHTHEFLPASAFKLYVDQLIERYCTHFVQWLNMKRPAVGHSEDYLTAMTHYHKKWEGFRSSEPWGDCEGRRLSYFFDSNYNRRIQEMEAQFVVNH